MKAETSYNRARAVPAGVALLVLAGLSLASPAEALDGRDYLDQCSGDDDVERRACREPIMAEIFMRQARQDTVPNPFRACPVDISEVEALEDLLAGLQKAFVDWLGRQPRRALDDPAEVLFSRAFGEIDVCNLD